MTQPNREFNAQNELARERNHLAADRSLLSFTRSSLMLISIGVGVDQVVSAIVPSGRLIDTWVYILSLLLVSLGVVTLVFAIGDYQSEMQRLKDPIYRYISRQSLGFTTGLLVLIIGILAFLGLGFYLWL